MKIRPFQGKTPQLGDKVFIDPSAIVIGDVEIGDNSSVWPLTVIHSPSVIM